MFSRYKKGEVSIGVLSKRLGLTISEALDLLASHGIPLSVSYDDYLVSRETSKKFIQ